MDWFYLRPMLRVAGRMLYCRIKSYSGLNPMILSHLVELKNKKCPDRVVLIFERENKPDEVVTYADIYFNAQKIGKELLNCGLKPGDRFAVYMRNHPEVIYALTAASMTGTVAVIIDPRNKGEILSYILNDSKSKLLVVADYLINDIKDIEKNIDIRFKYVLNSGDEGDLTEETKNYKSLNEVLEKPSKEYIRNSISDIMHPFQIIYTSGTTGMPKGVVQPNMRFFFMSALSYFFGYKKSDVLYTGLSLSHGNAQAVTVFPAIARELKAVVSRKFTKSRLWDITRKYRVTTFSLLGGMASGIFNEPPKPDDANNPVRMVVSAGTPRAIFDAFEKRFNLKILEWYAAVEGGFTFKPINKGPAGSFGKRSIPLLIDFRIVDENDNDCPPGVKGELISKMKIGETKVEYLGKKEDSEKKTRGGWLRSGDICHMDSEGWLFFDYRKGGEIRRHGDFVPVDMVEKIIGEIEEVSEVYVYGIPSSSGAPGESDLVAAVSPHPGKKIHPQKIFSLCRKKLPANFVPTYIQVLPEIPKTPSEKPKDHFLKTTFDPSQNNVFKEDAVQK
jgi:crotonobetaine/carnitine-CoA ligase